MYLQKTGLIGKSSVVKVGLLALLLVGALLTFDNGEAYAASVTMSTFPSPATGTAPFTVSFGAVGLPPSDTVCPAATYTWYFGEGLPETGTSASTKHTYKTAGSYQATVIYTRYVGFFNPFNPGCGQETASESKPITVSSSGGPPPPPPGEVSIRVDHGCAPTGSSYSAGSPIAIFYKSTEAGTAALYDFDPGAPSGPTIFPRGSVPAGIEVAFPALIGSTAGVETIVLQVMTVSGRVRVAACSFSIGGVSTTLATVSTNKGCEATFAAGEAISVSYSVAPAIPVVQVRIFNVTPMGLSDLTAPPSGPLTGQTGTVPGTVSAAKGDRMLVAVPVTSLAGVISTSCRYTVP